MRTWLLLGVAALAACSVAVSTEGLQGGDAPSSSSGGSSSGGSSSGSSSSSSSGGSSSGSSSSSASSGGSSSGASSSSSSGGTSSSSSSSSSGGDASTYLLVYSTGFEGTECTDWGGTKDAAGRSGSGCRLCGAGLSRTLSASAPPGTYVFEAWGRRAADPTPTGMKLRLEMAGLDAEKEGDVTSAAFSKVTLTLPTSTSTTSEVLRLFPVGALGAGDCVIVDDVAFYRK